MLITYEYECGSCGHRFEREQHISEEPVRECPKCGKEPHRLISGGSGFIWKGGDNGPGRFSTNGDSGARNKWGRVTEKKAAGGKKRPAGAARKEGHP